LIGFKGKTYSRSDEAGRLRQHTTCGILMHSSLGVTAQGLLLGLCAIKFWSREKFKGTAALEKPRVPIEEKESVKWLLNLRPSTALINEPRRCVHIGDRESDGRARRSSPYRRSRLRARLSSARISERLPRVPRRELRMDSKIKTFGGKVGLSLWDATVILLVIVPLITHAVFSRALSDFLFYPLYFAAPATLILYLFGLFRWRQNGFKRPGAEDFVLAVLPPASKWLSSPLDLVS
jgi:hypothetical protein